MEVVDRKKMMKRMLLVLSSIMFFVGTAGGPLLMRLYFTHGGKRIWLTTWLNTAAFPVTLIPITIAYVQRTRRQNLAAAAESQKPARLILMEMPLFLAATFIGLISAVVDYFLSYGSERLPVSTGAVITATQLCFTAVSAYLLVKQKFTFYSVNAVLLLTVGAAVLALHTSSDRPSGESNKQYVMGFLATFIGSAVDGSLWPLIELTYKKSKQVLTYALVMEIQFVISFVASTFCIVGMVINNDFKVIPREARDFGLGETNYYTVLLWSAILFQMSFFGAVGVIFCSSALLSGIMTALCLPLTEVLAVIFLKEQFQVEKGVALALSLWGFFSYSYGELKQKKKNDKNQDQECELPTQNPEQLPS